MHITVKPYEGFDHVSFGKSRDEIRTLINDEVDSFYRTTESKVQTDSFDNIGIFVNYDENYNCEAFEFSEPAEPVFQDMNLLKLSYSKLLDWFSKHDSQVDEFDSGFTSFKYGIGFYAPDKDEEPESPCEGVIIFKKGYYD